MKNNSEGWRPVIKHAEPAVDLEKDEEARNSWRPSKELTQKARTERLPREKEALTWAEGLLAQLEVQDPQELERKRQILVGFYLGEGKEAILEDLLREGLTAQAREYALSSLLFDLAVLQQDLPFGEYLDYFAPDKEWIREKVGQTAETVHFCDYCLRMVPGQRKFVADSEPEKSLYLNSLVFAVPASKVAQDLSREINTVSQAFAKTGLPSIEQAVLSEGEKASLKSFILTPYGVRLPYVSADSAVVPLETIFTQKELEAILQKMVEENKISGPDIKLEDLNALVSSAEASAAKEQGRRTEKPVKIEWQPVDLTEDLRRYLLENLHEMRDFQSRDGRKLGLFFDVNQEELATGEPRTRIVFMGGAGITQPSLQLALNNYQREWRVNLETYTDSQGRPVRKISFWQEAGLPYSLSRTGLKPQSEKVVMTMEKGRFNVEGIYP